MSDSSDEVDRLRSAHVVAITLLGTACLFAFPSEKEDRLDKADVALKQLRTIHVPKATEAPAGTVYDVVEKPTLEWFANLADKAKDGGQVTFDVLRAGKKRNLARLFADIETFADQNKCQTQTKDSHPAAVSRDETRGERELAPIDEISDDIQHDALERALDGVQTAYCTLEEAKKAHKKAEQELVAARTIASTAPSTKRDKAKEAEKTAATEFGTAKTAAGEAQAKLVERSREIERARGRGGEARALAVTVTVNRSRYYVSMSISNDRSGGKGGFSSALVKQLITQMKRSGAWEAIHGLDRDAAQAVLYDKKTEAQLGGELLGIQLSGADALRWFGLPLSAASLYSAVLAFRLRLEDTHWVRGPWGIGLSALIALCGIAVVNVAFKAGRLNAGFASLETLVLCGTIAAAIALEIACLFDWLRLRKQGPPGSQLRTRTTRKS